MRLTETILKKLINEVLEEGMRTAADLPEDTYIMIDGSEEDEIYILYVDQNGRESKTHPYGTVSLETEVSMADDFPCYNAFMVAYSDVAKGWGPLLYDVAIEIATLKGGGLVSDRSIVSQDAYDVWEKYRDQRTDVKKIQLDNEYDSLTYPKDDPLKREPIPFDNCLQNISYEYEEKAGIPWHESPLSKLYRKPPTTIKALEKSGRLLLNQINL